MNWLCWNVRGLGNQRTVRELEVVTRAQDPTALFLAETWAGEARLVSLCAELGFDHLWVTPKVNKLGCLALFWKDLLKIEVISSSSNHMTRWLGVLWKINGASLVFMALLIRRKSATLGLCSAACTRASLCRGYALGISTKSFGLMRRVVLAQEANLQ